MTRITRIFFFVFFCVFCCFYFEPQKTQKDAKIIYDSCCCNLLFLCILRILWFYHLRISRIFFICVICVICWLFVLTTENTNFHKEIKLNVFCVLSCHPLFRLIIRWRTPQAQLRLIRRVPSPGHSLCQSSISCRRCSTTLSNGSEYPLSELRRPGIWCRNAFDWGWSRYSR